MKKFKIMFIFFNLFFCFSSTFAMQKEILKNKPGLEKTKLVKENLEDFEILLTNQQLNILDELNISDFDKEVLKNFLKKEIKKKLNSQNSLEETLKNFIIHSTVVLPEENYNILLVFRDLQLFEENEKFYFQFKTILKNKIEGTKNNIPRKSIFKFKRHPKKEIFDDVSDEQINDEFEFSEEQRKELEEYRKKVYFGFTEDEIKKPLEYCFANNLEHFILHAENEHEILKLKFVLTSTKEKKFKMIGEIELKEVDETLEESFESENED